MIPKTIESTIKGLSTMLASETTETDSLIEDFPAPAGMEQTEYSDDQDNTYGRDYTEKLWT